MTTTHVARALILVVLAQAASQAHAQDAGPEVAQAVESAAYLAPPPASPGGPAAVERSVMQVDFGLQATPALELQPAAVERSVMQVDRARPEELASPARAGHGVSVGRVGGEAVGAVLGALAAGGLGLLVASAVCSAPDGGDCHTVALFAGGLTATAAFVLTVPLGVYIAGGLGDGRGRFEWSVLGTVAGSVAGLGLAYGMIEADAGALAWSALALSIAGAILGYELSSDDQGEAAPPLEARSSLQLVPSIGLTPDGEGVSLGLTGVM